MAARKRKYAQCDLSSAMGQVLEQPYASHEHFDLAGLTGTMVELTNKKASVGTVVFIPGMKPSQLVK